MNFLNPKKLIFEQLRERFTDAKVKSLLLEYLTKTDECKVKALDYGNKEFIVPINPKESNLVSNMLIKKITRNIDFDINKVVINVDMVKEEFRLYVCKAENNELVKIDF